MTDLNIPTRPAASVMLFFDPDAGWWYRLGGHTQGPFDSHDEALRDLNERWRFHP